MSKSNIYLLLAGLLAVLMLFWTFNGIIKMLFWVGLLAAGVMAWFAVKRFLNKPK